MMQGFQGKKILFISVSFFDYEKAIVKQLKELGAQVCFYDDRPSNSVIVKGLIRYDKRLLERKIRQYYLQILEDLDIETFDYFLLIKGEAIPPWFVKILKERNPQMKTIAYTYDSVAEHQSFMKISCLFDQVFTFDRHDALRYGWHFRPLFCIEEYRKATQSDHVLWDLSFIGTAHTDRYMIGEAVNREANKYGLRTWFYYYAPGKWYFKIRRIFDRHLKKFDIRKLSFRPLSHKDIKAVYEMSKAVLDINKPYQSGLTMRSFEVLLSKRKLLTFNADIVNYPFYDPQNIMILNRENISWEASFFQSEFSEIPLSTVEKMTLKSWLHCLFFQPQDEYWNSCFRDEEYKIL